MTARSVATHVAEAVRAAREDAGLSQVDVAEAIGVESPTICRAENSDARMNVSKLCCLAIALGVDPGSLLPTLEQARSLAGCQGIRTLDRRSFPTGTEYVGAVVAGAQAYLAKFDAPPNSKSGNADEFVGFETSWVAIDCALRRGSHGVEACGGLRDLLEQRGVILVGKALEEAILAGARAYRRKHGKRPDLHSGDAKPYLGYPGSWAHWNRVLKVGNWKTSRFCTLAAFLDSYGVGP